MPKTWWFVVAGARRGSLVSVWMFNVFVMHALQAMIGQPIFSFLFVL